MVEDALAGTLTDSGVLAFDDVDLSDTHTVVVSSAPSNALGGTLVATVTTAAAAGTGEIAWTYQLPNVAAQRLGLGETTTETFTVTVDDGNGGSVDQSVSIMIAGTNDAPYVLSSDVSGGVEEVAETYQLSMGAVLQLNSYTAGNQSQQYYNKSLAALPDGGFIAVWHSIGGPGSGQDGSLGGIFCQRLDTVGAPVGGEIQVNAFTAGLQITPSVATFADGGFVVVWQSAGQASSDYDIYARVFGAKGVAVGGETLVHDVFQPNQGAANVIVLESGDFVVAWSGRGRDGSDVGMFGQLHNSTGVPIGDNFQINTFSIGEQSRVTLSALKDGGFIAAWESAGQDGSGLGIYAQRYDSSASAVGSEFHVSTTTAGHQDWSSSAALADGGFVIVWT